MTAHADADQRNTSDDQAPDTLEHAAAPRFLADDRVSY
jgi:hypothetical protein